RASIGDKQFFEKLGWQLMFLVSYDHENGPYTIRDASGDFLPRNTTYMAEFTSNKTGDILLWTVRNCPKIKQLVLIDAPSFINPFNLAKELARSELETKPAVYCYLYDSEECDMETLIITKSAYRRLSKMTDKLHEIRRLSYKFAAEHDFVVR